MNYLTKPLTPEIREKIRKSEAECDDLTLRDVHCPHCGYLLDRVYSDASGHRQIKCRKCKEITVMNMAYFRRVKRKYYPESRRTYPPIR